MIDATGTTRQLLIVHRIPDNNGWSPITYMVSLARRLLQAEVLTLMHSQPPSRLEQALSVLLRRSANPDSPVDCLFLGAGPNDLIYLSNLPRWRTRFRSVSAWVIDSFWHRDIRRITRLADPFDRYFVTLPEDVPAWEKLTGRPAVHLPWGTDALGLGSAAADRDCDLMRVGRQPAEWDDDAAVAADAAAIGIRYRGRPACNLESGLDNQPFMMDAYRRTRFVLAFSNLAHPQQYTHPWIDYVTARWTDALACGATVAGIPPRAGGTADLLWDGATLDLGTVDRQAGLQAVATALKSWTPDLATRNHAQALRKLDWRWRFKTIADSLSLPVPRPLAAELALLEERIRGFQPA